MSKQKQISSTANNSNSKTTSKSVGKRIYKKWTSEEDDVLLDCVKKHPENLRLAFKNASNKLQGRSELSCSSRWYLSVSKNTGKDSIAFMCVSKFKLGRNRKNIRDNIGANNVTKWSRIWSSITNLFK